MNKLSAGKEWRRIGEVQGLLRDRLYTQLKNKLLGICLSKYGQQITTQTEWNNAKIRFLKKETINLWQPSILMFSMFFQNIVIQK